MDIKTQLAANNPTSIKNALTCMSIEDERKFVAKYVKDTKIEKWFKKTEFGEIIQAFFRGDDNCFHKRDVERCQVLDTNPLFEMLQFCGIPLKEPICLDYHLLNTIILFIGSKDALHSFSTVSEIWYLQILLTWDMLIVTKKGIAFRIPALAWESSGGITTNAFCDYTKAEARYIQDHFGKKTFHVLVNGSKNALDNSWAMKRVNNGVNCLFDAKNVHFLSISYPVGNLLLSQKCPNVVKVRTTMTDQLESFVKINPQITDLRLNFAPKSPPLKHTFHIKCLEIQIVGKFENFIHADLENVEKLEIVENNTCYPPTLFDIRIFQSKISGWKKLRFIDIISGYATSLLFQEIDEWASPPLSVRFIRKYDY